MGAELWPRRCTERGSTGVCCLELPVPLPSPAPSQGRGELGKGHFLLSFKGCSGQQWPKCSDLVSWYFGGGLQGGLGGLALPPTHFTVFSKTKAKKLSQSLQHVPRVHLAHPNHGVAGVCALQHLQDTPHPLGSQAPFLSPWDEVFLLSQDPSISWSGHGGVCRNHPSSGHPFDFGLSGGGAEPFGKEEKPLVVWVTSPWR